MRPVSIKATCKQRHLSIKYLHEKYLALGLSTNERADALVHHYTILGQTFPAAFLRSVLGNGVIVWTHGPDGARHSISICFSHPTDNEGELSLEYRFAGVLIHVASFSFVPGRLTACNEQTAMLVTRLQGFTHQYRWAQQAMKALHGLSAADALTAAFEGLASGLGLTGMFVTSAESQVCFDPSLRQRYSDRSASIVFLRTCTILRPGCPIRPRDLRET